MRGNSMKIENTHKKLDNIGNNENLENGGVSKD